MTNEEEKHKEFRKKRDELEGARQAAASLNSDNPEERNVYYGVAAQVASGAPFNLTVNDTTPARVLNEIHAFNIGAKTDALKDLYSNHKAALIEGAPQKGLENLVLTVPGKKIEGDDAHNAAVKAEDKFRDYFTKFEALRSGEANESQLRGEILPVVMERVKKEAEKIKYLTEGTRKLAVAIAHDIVSTTEGAVIHEVARLFEAAKEAYEKSFDDKHRAVDYARNKLRLADDGLVQDTLYMAGDKNILKGNRDGVYLGIQKASAKMAA